MFKPVSNPRVSPNAAGTGGTFSYEVIAPDKVGDHQIWVRRSDPVTVTRITCKLAAHTLNRADQMKSGDWLIGIIASEQRELDDLVFNFGRALCVFTGRDGAFL